MTLRVDQTMPARAVSRTGSPNAHFCHRAFELCGPHASWMSGGRSPSQISWLRSAIPTNAALR
ncbi:MAG: hypothetical protein OEU54_14580 [Gemmatimonadota bacterium]|nr:hypothetical protein [Gemmatimonadota bacterium]